MTRSNGKRLGLVLVALLGAAFAGASDCLIISEIVDGPLSGGEPKYVELTNVGTVSIDLAGYWLGNINNGAVSTTAPATQLYGILHPGDSYVCAYTNGDYPGNSTFYNVYGFDPDNFGFGAWINGNDVVVLYQGNPGTPHNGASAIDIYGVVGVDGTGQAWEYTDGYARRNANVTTNAGPWNPSQWTFGGPLSLADEADLLTLTTPGVHSYSGAPCGPAGTIGRCCVAPYYCYETTSALCTGMGGTWTAGQTCDGNPCGTPPPTGACCLGETCQEVTQADCTNMSGTWTGDSYCTPNPCLNCTSIPDAKLLGGGHEVQLCDVIVSNTIDLISSAANANFQVQEQSTVPGQRGGVTVFGTDVEISDLTTQYFEGDIINVQGWTDEFSGLFELVAPFTHSLVTFGTGERPEPIQISASDFLLGGIGEEIESMYVEVPCARYLDQGGGTTFAPFTNYTFVDTTGQFIVRVTDGTDVVGQPLPDPATPVTLRGIFNDFGGYQLLLTRYGDPNDVGGNPAGDLWYDPLCLSTGACCTGAQHDQCQVTTPTGCAGLGGTYQGGGTRCSPFNACLEPKGICCVGGLCTEEFESTCTAMGGGYLGDNTLCNFSPTPCPKAVLPGDIALGLSTGNQFTTAEQVRAGAKVGAWNNVNFTQSFEFDNFGGTWHNADGNLLALDYGTPLTGADPGGKIQNFSTDGSGRAQLQIYAFNGLDQGHGENANFKTRVTGLGISPDNQWLAIWGWDLKKLYLLHYAAGATVGTGTGASITGAWAFTPAHANSGGTQGCTFISNDTILMGNHAAAAVQLRTYQFNPANPAAGVTETMKYQVNFPSSGQSSDVEYDPGISPYVFVVAGAFSGSSTSYLAVVDPHLDPNLPGFGGPWTLVKLVDMSLSSQTARECALGADHKLYWSQFHSGTNTPYIEYVDVTNPAALTDNSSLDYYLGSTYASYSGLDMAVGTSAPPPCLGDVNCDGQVDFADINPFVNALLNAVYCDGTGDNADVSNNGSVGFEDINPFVALLTQNPLPIDCP